MKIENVPYEVILKTYSWLGDKGLRFFKSCLTVSGTCSPVFRLNKKRRRMPAYIVHFNEGMQVRNFLRSLPECRDWYQDDLDNLWPIVVLSCVFIYKVRKAKTIEEMKTLLKNYNEKISSEVISYALTEADIFMIGVV